MFANIGTTMTGANEGIDSLAICGHRCGIALAKNAM
jgi:hypothetical protein